MAINANYLPGIIGGLEKTTANIAAIKQMDLQRDAIVWDYSIAKAKLDAEQKREIKDRKFRGEQFREGVRRFDKQYKLAEDRFNLTVKEFDENKKYRNKQLVLSMGDQILRKQMFYHNQQMDFMERVYRERVTKQNFDLSVYDRKLQRDINTWNQDWKRLLLNYERGDIKDAAAFRDRVQNLNESVGKFNMRIKERHQSWVEEEAIKNRNFKNRVYADNEKHKDFNEDLLLKRHDLSKELGIGGLKLRGKAIDEQIRSSETQRKGVESRTDVAKYSLKNLKNREDFRDKLDELNLSITSGKAEVAEVEGYMAGLQKQRMIKMQNAEAAMEEKQSKFYTYKKDIENIYADGFKKTTKKSFSGIPLALQPLLRPALEVGAYTARRLGGDIDAINFLDFSAQKEGGVTLNIDEGKRDKAQWKFMKDMEKIDKKYGIPITDQGRDQTLDTIFQYENSIGQFLLTGQE